MTQCVPGKAGKPSLLAAAAAAAAPGMAIEAKAPGTPGIVNPVQDGFNFMLYKTRNTEGIRVELCAIVPAACWIAKAGWKPCAPGYGAAEMIPGVAAKYQDV